jgi:probable rRNA maturation factor
MEGAGDFSHPGDGYSIIGDMIISLDMLGETSKEFSVPQEEELKRLLIHGVLHLSGRDHKGGDSRQPMLMQQEDICRELAEEKIF